MTVPSAAPVQPIPPAASPPPPAVAPASRRSQLAALFLLLTAATLIGWRWYTDRHGTRPTEIRRDVAHQVDLNRATRSELMQIPGVGPGLAERIVTHRDGHGPFTRVEDLDRVPGIGDGTLQRIRPWVMVLGVESDAGPIEPDRLSRKPTATRHVVAKPAGSLVNVNTATLDELNTLPGIGPVLAQRMIDERAKRPFASVEELRRVSGIGPKKLEALRPLVMVGE